MIQLLLTSLAPLLWGTSYWVTTEFLPPNRPLLSAVLRVVPAGLLFVAVSRWFPPREWWGKIVVLGLLNFGVFFALLFEAAYRLPGGVGSTLGGLGPLFIAFLAWPILGIRPRVKTLVVGVIGIAGVALLVLGPGARWDALGIVAVLAAVGCMSLGGVLAKRWGRPASMAGYVGWQLVVSGVLLAPICLGFEGALPPLTPTNWGAYGYLSLAATGLAYALWFRGIEKVGLAVSFLTLLGPLVAVALGAVFLGQGVTLVQGVAMALVLGSAVAGSFGPGKTKKR